MTAGAHEPEPGSGWALPRGLIVLLTFSATVITIAGLRAFASILGPVLLALTLTIGVHPVFPALRRRGWPAWASATVMIVASCAVVLGIAVSMAVSLAQLATLLPSYQPRFAELTAELSAELAGLGVGAQQVREALSGIDFGAIARLIGGLLLSFASTLSSLVLLLTLLLFMGVDAAGFGDRVAAIGGSRPHMVTALAGFVRGTRSYLVVTTVFGLIVAVLDGAALWLLGVPLAGLWALLAFVTNYIPNIGFVIGVVPPVLLALLEGGPQLAVTVTVVYIVINFVIQSMIQPKYVGDAVDLSLTLTFLSLVFWAWVLGAVGAILAVPLTLLAKALLVDSDPHTRWVNGFLTSSRPAPAAPAPPPAEPAEPAAQPG